MKLSKVKWCDLAVKTWRARNLQSWQCGCPRPTRCEQPGPWGGLFVKAEKYFMCEFFFKTCECSSVTLGKPSLLRSGLTCRSTGPASKFGPYPEMCSLTLECLFIIIGIKITIIYRHSKRIHHDHNIKQEAPASIPRDCRSSSTRWWCRSAPLAYTLRTTGSTWKVHGWINNCLYLCNV